MSTKIAICGSMQFTEKMLEVNHQLQSMGFDSFVTDYAEEYSKYDLETREQQTIVDKTNPEEDAMREFLDKINDCDAILVLNYDKKGIANYIGGNTFLGMGHSYYNRIKIYLLNPIPEVPIYKSEIKGMHPVILNGDLTKIE